jgi:hypothetical protein
MGTLFSAKWAQLYGPIDHSNVVLSALDGVSRSLEARQEKSNILFLKMASATADEWVLTWRDTIVWLLVHLACHGKAEGGAALIDKVADDAKATFTRMAEAARMRDE